MNPLEAPLVLATCAAGIVYVVDRLIDLQGCPDCAHCRKLVVARAEAYASRKRWWTWRP